MMWGMIKAQRLAWLGQKTARQEVQDLAGASQDLMRRWQEPHTGKSLVSLGRQAHCCMHSWQVQRRRAQNARSSQAQRPSYPRAL